MKKIQKKYQCLPFWSWNDELDEEKLVEQIEWMNKNGIGGFFMHARGGLKTPYLGEKWFSCVEACQRKAKELGMEAYAYDENGWPSGFAGGKLLEDINNHDMYLTYNEGEYDKNSIASYVLKDNKLIRVFDGNKCINVFAHYSTSTADILNPDVVDKFIELTHKEYKKHDKDNSLVGFFTDEPQYFRWGQPYTKMLKEYFKTHYNEDILDSLGLIFIKADGYRAFRYKYWKAMQDLMLNNYAKKIYDYCDQNGYKLTGHYVEEVSLSWQMMCCAGIMPFYEFEHIPGVDLLGRNIGSELAPKQVGSVAAQLDKKQVIGEMFAMVGWDATPQELKRSAEYLYVDGVNLMCQHLLPYSEYGQRKRDYPEHFSTINPWVRNNFKEFNDYFSVLGEHLSNSKEIVNVGIIHPIRSAYFEYCRSDEQNDCGLSDLNSSLFALLNTLSSKHIPHHFIDETLLKKHGHVEDKSFIVGCCKYDYLILPKMFTMDKSTEEMLHQYVSNGGKVLLFDGKPTYLEGEEHEYPYLNSNTSFEEILASLPYTSDENESVKLSYRTDKDNKPYFYLVNLGEKTKLHINVNGYKNFKVYDILTDSYKIISSNIDFEKYQSYIVYPTNEELKEEKKLEPLYLDKKYILANEVINNYLTLDFVRYSLDGKTYSEKLHNMGVFDILLNKRYKGDLYLKYDFDIKDIPSICSALIEKDRLDEVIVNGHKVITDKVSKEEYMLADFDIAKYLRTGNNEIIIKLNYYQSEDVYYALFGENVTEGLKNCLVYDTNVEPIYLKGNFGVYGNFIPGKDETILLGSDFYLAKQKMEITQLITDGFPFFSGEISLKQNINITNTNKYVYIDQRFMAAKIKVNNNLAGNLLLTNKLDISNLLTSGENEIELALTISNRNLFGPFHTQEQEDLGVAPITFERPGTWKDGKSSILRESYSFVKTII